MKKVLSTLVLLLLLGSAHAEPSDAEKIFSILKLEVFPEIADPLASAALKERREEYNIKVQQLMAQNLEQKMTAEELKASYEFLKSPVGKKFFESISGTIALEAVLELVKEYNQFGRN